MCVLRLPFNLECIECHPGIGSVPYPNLARPQVFFYFIFFLLLFYFTHTHSGPQIANDRRRYRHVVVWLLFFYFNSRTSVFCLMMQQFLFLWFFFWFVSKLLTNRKIYIHKMVPGFSFCEHFKTLMDTGVFFN